MGDDGFIGLTCPYCEASSDFQSHYGGTVQTCPNCGKTLVVPKEDGGAGTALPLPIQTAQVELRRFQEDDWEQLGRYIGNPELFRYVDHEPIESDEDVAAWVQSVSNEQITNRNERLYLAVVDKAAGQVVGDASLWLIDQDHLQASFDLCIGSDFHQKGYGLESVKGLLQFCFQSLGMHRVIARCDGRNEAAIKLLSRAGMRQEGVFVKCQRREGEWVDAVRFALLAEEYAAL